MKRALAIGLFAAVAALAVWLVRPSPPLRLRPAQSGEAQSQAPSPSPSPFGRPGGFVGVVERSRGCRPDSQVNVCATSLTDRRCQVTDGGRFSLQVPPGSYKILAVCEQLIAEHVGVLDVAEGEVLDGLVLELRPQGIIGLTVKLAEDGGDEPFDLFTDPPSHDWTRMHEHHAVGGPMELPLGPLPLGEVHVWARGRCLAGDLRVKLMVAGQVTRATLQLTRKPCGD